MLKSIQLKTRALGVIDIVINDFFDEISQPHSCRLHACAPDAAYSFHYYNTSSVEEHFRGILRLSLMTEPHSPIKKKLLKHTQKN